MVRGVCADVQMALAGPCIIRDGSMHRCTRWRMTIPSLYKDQKDEALHQRAIEKLARKLNRPIPPVKVVYENEYARLKIDAKVTSFLGVFASRRARDVLLRTPA